MSENRLDNLYNFAPSQNYEASNPLEQLYEQENKQITDKHNKELGDVTSKYT